MSVDLAIETVPIDAITPDPRNARRHPERNMEALRASLTRFGQRKPIILWGQTVIAGNGTLQAARDLGWAEIAVTRVPASWSEAEAKAYAIADNRTAELAEWDPGVLSDTLHELAADGWEMPDLGFTPIEVPDLDLGGQEGQEAEPPGLTLADRYLIPPLSCLDQRSGLWQARRRAWLALGIRSEEGRDSNLLGMSDTILRLQGPKKGLTMPSASGRVPTYYAQKNAAEAALGRPLSNEEFERDHLQITGEAGISTSGTSVFDPVLCEIIYRWFTAPGGEILDPFAGGSVRGITAAALGRNYHGLELRPEQVAANEEQWDEIKPLLPDDLPDPEPISDPQALTPIIKTGDVWVKRDDTFQIGGSRGGKVRACAQIIQAALQAGPVAGLVTAGSRQSPQVNIVATLAAHHGLPCRVHVPSGSLTPELEAARAAGAEIIQHSPGYNNVIIARAREDAEESGWLEIPFGMEHPAIIQATAAQTAGIPKGVKRIVVPVGSGMALAGILQGLQQGKRRIPVLGIQVGADPTDRLNEYAPGWQEHTTLIPADWDYHDPAPNRLNGITLDPIYEAKCLPHLQAGDLLWAVGRRETTHPQPLGSTRWSIGDSRQALDEIPNESVDLIFSCPPYADLEQYSDDPTDLSNMPYDQFIDAYRDIIAKAVQKLRPNRFAAWVVGEIRDPKGNYRAFIPHTIQAFQDAGAAFYNEGILIQPVGSLAIRANRTFSATRKLSKNHQQVLIFTKGDPKAATQWCGPVQTAPLTTEDDEL